MCPQCSNPLGANPERALGGPPCCSMKCAMAYFDARNAVHIADEPYCCDGLKEEDARNDILSRQADQWCIVQCHSFDDSFTYHPISFCPFCGTKLC